MVTTDQAGETDADAYSPTHTGIQWRYCRKHTGVPRSSGSLPKTCAKKLWRTTKEKSSVPVRQHFVLTNARYLSHTVSLSFIVQGGRPFTSH